MNSKDIRRKNLRELAEKAESGAAFAKQADMPPSLLSQVLSKTPTRNIGDRLARKIEERLNLPSGWLDQDHAAGIKAPKATNETQTVAPGNDKYQALLKLGKLIEDFTPSELSELEAQVELIRRRKHGGF